MSLFQYTAANYPIPHMGLGKGQTKNIEDHVRLLTVWARATQRVMMGAFGGPEYLEAALALMSTNDSVPFKQGGKGVTAAGHRLGQRTIAAEGEKIYSQEAALEVVRVSDASAQGSSIQYEAAPLLSVMRMRSKGGSVQDDSPLIYLGNHVCTQGDKPTGNLIGSDTDFEVGPEGQVCGALAGFTEIRVDKLKVQEGSKCCKKDEDNCATYLTATDDGMAVQGYALADGSAVTNAAWSFSKSIGGMVHETGTAAYFQSPDGTKTTGVVQTDANTLGVVPLSGGDITLAGDVNVSGTTYMGDATVDGKLTVTGLIDPTGIVFTPQGSDPMSSTQVGLYAGTTAGTNEPWWRRDDGTVVNLLTGGGGGGGDHDVADAATNTSVVAVALNHTTSSTAAAGFGVYMDWELEDAAGNTDVAARLDTVWTTATDGSEDADFIASVLANGTLEETLRLDADGGTGTPQVLITGNGAGTNDTSYMLKLSRPTTGTAAGNFGTGVDLELESAGGSMVSAGGFRCYWSSASAGSEKSVLGWTVKQNGADQEALYLSGGTNNTSLQLYDTGGAGTNNVFNAFTMRRGTTATAADGFGTGMAMTLEAAAGTFHTTATMQSLWTDATNKDADFVVSVTANNSTTEALRIDADGDGAGGTATAVRCTTGRLDLAEQATPGDPVANYHRLYFDDETTWARDENGERRALDNVVLQDTDATDQLFTGGGGGSASYKSLTVPAGYLATDGDSLRITASGGWDAAALSNVGFEITVGGTAIVGVTGLSVATAGRWKIELIIKRRGATSAMTNGEVLYGSDSADHTQHQLQRDTTGFTWANSQAVAVKLHDSGSNDKPFVDELIIEPLIRA